MGARNYYEVLGVKNNATAEEIKAAYREKVKNAHPDKGNQPNGVEFEAVRKAYEILKDSEKRAEYDETLREQKSSRAAKNSDYTPFDEDVFFENLIRNQELLKKMFYKKSQTEILTDINYKNFDALFGKGKINNNIIFTNIYEKYNKFPGKFK